MGLTFSVGNPVDAFLEPFAERVKNTLASHFGGTIVLDSDEEPYFSEELAWSGWRLLQEKAVQAVTAGARRGGWGAGQAGVAQIPWQPVTNQPAKVLAQSSAPPRNEKTRFLRVFCMSECLSKPMLYPLATGANVVNRFLLTTD